MFDRVLKAPLIIGKYRDVTKEMILHLEYLPGKMFISLGSIVKTYKAIEKIYSKCTKETIPAANKKIQNLQFQKDCNV